MTLAARLRTATCLLAFAATAALAQPAILVDKAWVRTTVPKQDTTAAYLTISAPQGGRLVAVSSPVAASVQIHEMRMDGTTMRMRAVKSLALPQDQPVVLKPGGFHLMLVGLKAPVKFGDLVPLTLVVEDAAGKKQSVDVQAIAKTVL